MKMQYRLMLAITLTLGLMLWDYHCPEQSDQLKQLYYNVFGPHIDLSPENCARIQNGLTKSEVCDIIGGRPGKYRNGCWSTNQMHLLSRPPDHDIIIIRPVFFMPSETDATYVQRWHDTSTSLELEVYYNQSGIVVKTEQK